MTIDLKQYQAEVRSIYEGINLSIQTCLRTCLHSGENGGKEVRKECWEIIVSRGGIECAWSKFFLFFCIFRAFGKQPVGALATLSVLECGSAVASKNLKIADICFSR